MKSSKFSIASVRAREILDSRANPTVEATVVLAGGASGTASVPSGASTGSHEAAELRDGNKKRYAGKGVLRAVANVNGPLSRVVRGRNAGNQQALDHAMIRADGTPDKSRFGANALLAVSLAAARAASIAHNLPLYRSLRATFKIQDSKIKLPIPMMNVLNGGVHAEWALDVQEFMIVPLQRAFRERLRAGVETYHALKKLLAQKGFPTQVGDEGGFAPRLPGNEAGLQTLVTAIRAAGYRPGTDIALATDAASSEWYDAPRERYRLRADKKNCSGEDLIPIYERWLARYPLISLEDPFAEDDWVRWTELTKKIGKRVTIVGDDLFTTNPKRLMRGVRERAANAILIKLNQIGTLTETMDVIARAKRARFSVIVSHRSGETADDFIADLSVAAGTDYIKTGAPARSERSAKYNRLLAIEDEQ